MQYFVNKNVFYNFHVQVYECTHKSVFLLEIVMYNSVELCYFGSRTRGKVLFYIHIHIVSGVKMYTVTLVGVKLQTHSYNPYLNPLVFVLVSFLCKR